MRWLGCCGNRCSDGLPDLRMSMMPSACAMIRRCAGLLMAKQLLDMRVIQLTSLKEKLIKIGAKVVSHGRYVAFQMAEVAIPRTLFADVLRLIAELRPPPDPAQT